MRTFHVYVLANKSRRLYVGVTNDLTRRVWEHRYGLQRGFTRRYNIGMLLHFETFTDARSAIAREKHLKAVHHRRVLVHMTGAGGGWSANPQGREIPTRFARGMTSARDALRLTPRVSRS
jgi:putative endonuclease